MILPNFPKDDDHDYNTEIEQMIFDELFSNHPHQEENNQDDDYGWDAWPYVEE